MTQIWLLLAAKKKMASHNSHNAKLKASNKSPVVDLTVGLYMLCSLNPVSGLVKLVNERFIDLFKC